MSRTSSRSATPSPSSPTSCWLVRDGKLTIAATDLEISLVEEVPAQTSRKRRHHRAGLPPCTKSSAAQPDNAEIELDHAGGDAQLCLRAGRYATSLVALSVDEFPKLDAGKLSHHFVLSAQELRGLIDRTRFAISTEETRYYLNGIFLHAAEAETGPVLRAVATDGHRLARVEEPLPTGAAGMPGIIIPRKTVTELRKLLDEISGEIEVALSETRIQFTIGSMRLTSKLIDGTFPDYDRVIPRGNDKILRVDKKDFNDAVGRVSAISAERHRPVKLSLAKDLLVISAASPEQGTASEELGARNWWITSLGPLEIGFQARYLSDVTETDPRQGGVHLRRWRGADFGA